MRLSYKAAVDSWRGRQQHKRRVKALFMNLKKKIILRFPGIKEQESELIFNSDLILIRLIVHYINKAYIGRFFQIDDISSISETRTNRSALNHTRMNSCIDEAVTAEECAKVNSFKAEVYLIQQLCGWSIPGPAAAWIKPLQLKSFTDSWVYLGEQLRWWSCHWQLWRVGECLAEVDDGRVWTKIHLVNASSLFNVIN